MSTMIGKSRTADPAELAQTSRLVKAWERLVREKRAGDDLAYEHWYAFLLGIARPVPRPVCDVCDDCGVVEMECTVDNRCLSRLCEPDARRSDPMHRHTYVRACYCEAGNAYRASFAAAAEPRRQQPAQKHTGYGFRKAVP